MTPPSPISHLPSAGLRCLHVLACANAATGGPAVSVPALVRGLRAHGVNASLATLDYPELGPLPALPPGALQTFAPNPLTRPLRGWSPALSRFLRHAAAGADLVHNHGLWMFPNHDAARAARAARKPFLLSPRGMLGPWALRRTASVKQILWMLREQRDTASARMLHATSAAEAADLRRLGLRQPIAVIPNPVDLPAAPPPPRGLIDEAFPSTRGRRIALFLSRLHPKKGLPELLHAWNACPLSLRNDWLLLIAGPDLTGHAPEIRALAEGLPDVLLHPRGIDDPLKSALLAHADFLALPTHEENFGIVVAEALAHGTPVLTTRAAPWPMLESEEAGWWIPDPREALRRILPSILSLPPADLRARGARGRAWIGTHLSSSHLARQMLSAYQWLLDPASPTPPCVSQPSLADFPSRSSRYSG
jgi:glycosyltransferase involved in cell wall biosynthesis